MHDGRRSWLLVLTFSVGCHNCGKDDPIMVAETDTFGPSTTSGFFDDTTTGFITTVPVDGTIDDGGGDTAAPGTTTGGSPDECQASADCGVGMVCVAPFDQSLGPEGKGDNACVSECVEEMDEDRWCADADACCNSLHVCTDRGYCVLPGGSGSGGTDTGGADTGGTDTGATDTGGSGGGGSTGTTGG